MAKETSQKITRSVLLQLLLGIIIGLFTSQAFLKILHWRRRSSCRLPGDDNGRHTGKIQSREVSERHIFAGVMTSRKHLQTRADAIYKTWGKDFPGQLVFFIGTGDDVNSSLPVVVLTNVSDEAYPPQRKCFEMLRYMSQHHGHDFHWFMRLDDDVYVNTDLLKTFLTSVNSSLHEYMGHSGLGAKTEKGRLGLHGKTPYCLGGPGVVLSGPILRQVAPHLSGCLKDPATPHEDTELGRCIYNVTGLSCTWQSKWNGLFQASYKDKTGTWAVRMNPQKAVKKLSFHPVKQPTNQFLLHKMFLTKTLKEKHSYKVLLERETSPITIKEYDSTPWTCINASSVYSLEPIHLKDFQRHLVLMSVQALLKPLLKTRQLQLSPIAYQRVSAPSGLEHAVVTRDRKKNYWVVRTRQNFHEVYFRELPPRKNSVKQ